MGGGYRGGMDGTGGGSGDGRSVSDTMSRRSMNDTEFGDNDDSFSRSLKPEARNLTIAASAVSLTQNDPTTWQIELLVTDADGQAVGDAEISVSVLNTPAIPSVSMDNLSTLAALQGEYQRNIERFRQSQRSRSVAIGIIVIFGGVALVVMSVILVVMRLASGLRMFVMGTVAGLSCIFVCVVMLRGQSGYEIASLEQSAKSMQIISAADSHESTDFAPQIVWQESDLRTDAAGRVRLEMTLPENTASTCHFIVEALSQDGKTGAFRSYLNIITDREE